MTDTDFDAAEHFGEDLSSVYDERIREIIPGYETMHAIAQHLLCDHNRDDANILVAGVGTGYETKAYALSRPKWNIIGFDPSANMLAAAVERIELLNNRDNIKLVHGSIEDVNENILFDGAASILVMQFLPDNGAKQHYLNEISKRLHRGAVLILIDLEGVKYSKEYNRLLSAWKSHQYATREDIKQIIRDFEHVDANLQFVSEERIRELLANAGFADICKFYKSLLFGGYIATKISV